MAEDGESDQDEFKEQDNNDQFMNMIFANDPNFQQFLMKATKIIQIFLKDKNTS